MNIPGQSFKQLCLLLLCLLAGGCSGCSGGSGSKPPPPPRTEDPIAQAREIYRKATEAPHFRNANERVNVYLASNPDAIARHHPGARDKATLQAILRKPLGDEVDKLDDTTLYQKFLQTVIGLDPAEIAEVENASLKLLDAHYLEACFLFREIARSMPLQGLSPLEQAEYCFSWVNRQVVLQEGREDFLPPQYVLQRGQGSAAERAVVFLSLLQQLTPAANPTAPHMEACLIALPSKDSQTRPLLAGVLIDTKGKPDVYLFDPRLGLPLPGPKGKGIATLAQLQAKPAAILDGLKLPGDTLKYDVTEKEAVKKDQTEILLCCPLSGLSGRMRFLEDDVFFGLDRINLAVRAAQTFKHFDDLKAGTVRIWDVPPAKPGLLPQAPTRVLRLFLPTEEGGIDTNHRLDAFKVQLLPAWAVELAFAEQKLSRADPGKDAFERLENIAFNLWINYGVVPAQQLVRGRLDDCSKRLVRMQKVLYEDGGKNLSDAAVAKWREKVRGAFLSRDEAKIMEVFAEDEWLAMLVSAPDEELTNPKSVRKSTLSAIVLKAVGEVLAARCNYLLALRWQEMAERAQVHASQLAAGGASDQEKAKAKQEAQGAWQSAATCWNVYADSNPLLQQHQNANRKDLPLGLKEHYQGLLRQAAAARLLHGRALRQAAKADEAVAMLKKLVADLAAIEKNAVPGAPNSLYWIQYTARLQIVRWDKGRKG